MAVLHLIDRQTGDKQVQWEKDNLKDLEKARSLFNEKKKNGWMAHGYKKGLALPFLMQEFDEECDRIVMHEPFVGG